MVDVTSSTAAKRATRQNAEDRRRRAPTRDLIDSSIEASWPVVLPLSS